MKLFSSVDKENKDEMRNFQNNMLNIFLLFEDAPRRNVEKSQGLLLKVENLKGFIEGKLQLKQLKIQTSFSQLCSLTMLDIQCY